MALDVYFREDIENVIRAGLQLSLGIVMQKEANPAFVAGLLLAFRHQAQAVGILWQGAARDEYDQVTVGILDQVIEASRRSMVELIEAGQRLIEE